MNDGGGRVWLSARNEKDAYAKHLGVLREDCLLRETLFQIDFLYMYQSMTEHVDGCLSLFKNNIAH